ncbi:MAG TPA: glycosyltransferase, partial [Myxococcota bacterium]|nr:glycosyltransferase [Myxococcota bacterium]
MLQPPVPGAVALVHDWLVSQRGGENVLLTLARMFPEAPIYTLVHGAGRVHPELERRIIHTSFIQRLPGAPRRFRPYLPLFPRAVEAWDLSAYDTVISTSHCVAKGIRTHAGQRHVAYIHTPMRYLWDQMPHYLPRPARLWTPLARLAAWPLRRWDVTSAQRPDVLVANSEFVAARIGRVWGRASEVIYPPVDVDFFAAAPDPAARRGFVAVSALVPYKRLELAIGLANARRLPLTVVGEGAERARLRALAGPTVRFEHGLSREALRALYAGAEALLFAGEEDFGIVPVEAMAAGCPVIAFDAGGLRETVVGEGEGATGVFFGTPSVAAMGRALDTFLERRDRGAFGRAALTAQARLFAPERFTAAMARLLS